MFGCHLSATTFPLHLVQFPACLRQEPWSQCYWWISSKLHLDQEFCKVRYVMRRVFGDPKEAPPPLERLSPDQLVSALWKGEGSLVEELLQCMGPHLDVDVLNDLKSKISDHDPYGSNLQMELRKSLLWLRDELRDLPCSYKCRNDAAADLIHIYASTKCFFRVREYKTVTSPPVYISPLDLGPKYVDKMGPGFQEYCKTYGENYCLGQLIYWHNQASADPDCNLARARRGCLTLPDIGSFYTKSQKPSRERIYSLRTLRFMLARMVRSIWFPTWLEFSHWNFWMMLFPTLFVNGLLRTNGQQEKQPQRPWPKDQVWVFNSAPRIFGSPMMDAVLNNCPLDKEMVHWLKSRPSVFEAMWDG
ncbi:hypothetical protein Taro_012876 [Colocasia esculenta]|uniref:ATXR3 C-terminal domain-containing protein n=1 Tax=Colocasia esculenta TaxID=4460 RepID=A0A843UH27_COLES|nr:hypothetical protein [Colocasia esculenta]